MKGSAKYLVLNVIHIFCTNKIIESYLEMKKVTKSFQLLLVPNPITVENRQEDLDYIEMNNYQIIPLPLSTVRVK